MILGTTNLAIWDSSPGPYTLTFKNSTAAGFFLNPKAFTDIRVSGSGFMGINGHGRCSGNYTSMSSSGQKNMLGRFFAFAGPSPLSLFLFRGTGVHGSAVQCNLRQERVTPRSSTLKWQVDKQKQSLAP